MDGKITYCNTDLDLKSVTDLTTLAAEFGSRGLVVLCFTLGEDGYWYSTVEANEPWAESEKREPERSIREMLTVIESLAEPLQATWSSCTLCEFNIGYDCGAEPWAFNQELSNEILRRIVTAGASLRITLYPDRPECCADGSKNDAGTEE
jgi:hypothetical protein